MYRTKFVDLPNVQAKYDSYLAGSYYCGYCYHVFNCYIKKIRLSFVIVKYGTSR